MFPILTIYLSMYTLNLIHGLPNTVTGATRLKSGDVHDRLWRPEYLFCKRCACEQGMLILRIL